MKDVPFCDCYRPLEPLAYMLGECLGVKGNPRVDCFGDEKRCFFFPEKRRKHLTNYDRLTRKSPEALADWINAFWSAPWCPEDAPIDPETKECKMHDGECRLCILDWLKEEARDGE